MGIISLHSADSVTYERIKLCIYLSAALYMNIHMTEQQGVTVIM
jgi:hypothetical protein